MIVLTLALLQLQDQLPEAWNETFRLLACEEPGRHASYCRLSSLCAARRERLGGRRFGAVLAEEIQHRGVGFVAALHQEAVAGALEFDEPRAGDSGRERP